MKSNRHFPRSVPGEARSRLLEFLALHCGIGAGFGIVLAATAVLTDFSGIGTLIAETSDPIVPWVLFFASFALTFASLKMGMAVMMLPLEPPDETDNDDGGDGNGPAELPEPTVAGQPGSLSPPQPEEPASRGPDRLLGRRE